MNKKKSTFQDALMLTDKGYRDLKKAIAACTLTNFSMFIPAMVMLQVVMELLKPFTGGSISWTNMWIYFGLGIIGAVIVFLCNKNDYKKTYVASYMESENTRIALAEHIRKLPMSVFNSKNLSELTTNLMGDVATSEHVLSHVYPQIISNVITITVVCIMFAFYAYGARYFYFRAGCFPHYFCEQTDSGAAWEKACAGETGSLRTGSGIHRRN